ncbi:Glycosyltransferase [uncultured Desulfobacterium sp.]|uniref:Glycosyltransferase n=1 Tax=uncultured Desulfobacterium sp. TaxID=201089 RepID=A0A445MS00_9BACT|nr:Glycosyltransferase [uncultured Desulfobacterium sp.]
MIELSIVIPVYNEEDLISPLIKEIDQVLGEDRERTEVIFVNDGSTDKTEPILLKLQERYPVVRVISFERNAGQSAAMICGFRHAKGKYVVSLDGDGQNDPRDIPRIVELLEKYQVVCGIRARRQDSLPKRLGSKFARYVRQKVLGDSITDVGCSLKGFHREVLQKLYFFDGAHRFIPILLEMEGCSVGQVEVNHRPRTTGVSKYTNLGRLAKTWLDLIGVYWIGKRRLNYQIKHILNGKDGSDG